MVPAIVMSLVSLAVALAAITFVARKHATRRAVWRAFAERNGFEYAEKIGPWYRRRGPIVTGAIDGAAFTLEQAVVRHGHGSAVHTRARAQLDRPLDSALIVRPRNWMNRLQYVFGPPAVETGSTSFDERYIVRSKSRVDALEMIDDDVRARMLAMPQALHLYGDAQEIRLSWRRSELDPAELDAACTLIAALSRTRRASHSSAARPRGPGSRATAARK